MLNTVADASAPFGESENSEFFRVIATGFTAISEPYPNIRIIIVILSFRKSSGLDESSLDQELFYLILRILLYNVKSCMILKLPNKQTKEVILCIKIMTTQLVR